MNKQNKHIGKLMSLALRHQPDVLQLELDKQGWVHVTDLLKGLNRKGIRIDRARLNEIVETNDKKRYAFSEDGLKIRANQGHSIKVELNLIKQEPPYTLYHGTVGKFMQNINEKGLLKMSRQHVHLSATKDTATAVGSRRGRPVILKINAKEMHENGFDFYCSENGVWLTEHVPPEFFERMAGTPT